MKKLTVVFFFSLSSHWAPMPDFAYASRSFYTLSLGKPLHHPHNVTILPGLKTGIYYCRRRLGVCRPPNRFSQLGRVILNNTPKKGQKYTTIIPRHSLEGNYSHD
ncbi:hypothetical protein NADFUDRAFT_84080 [Nadsonia fulvescens var. elongata DSM 6958]|uniref:Uncharacterized protein n=1 Tax=Nadsonia fulvescens var. elongata DSM 6958 TaxID=857566 RepID=A0A1E3PGR8_9ASCO|nr:hypothetical protein NADFUDRAFT_84080 [Nadsonia fulvescens var. elongata DSM 6958]